MTHKHKAIPTPQAEEPTNHQHLKESLAAIRELLVDPHANSLHLEQEVARAEALAVSL